MNEIFKNYDAFYTMVTSTLIMSNSPSGSFNEDCKKIIDFIAQCYGFDKELTQKCTHAVMQTIAPIGLIADKNAIYGARNFGDEFSDEDVLNDIKCDVISLLEKIADGNSNCINPEWFNYDHYFTYQPDIRYEEIKRSAAGGNIIANRQVAILNALGIGCKADLKSATNRFLKSALWGDLPSVKMLAHTYQLCGNEEMSKVFAQVAELADKYLFSGTTVIPAEDKDNYCEEARTYYVYMSTIFQDIVYANGVYNVDYSFLEAILSDNLNYFDRMRFIDEYDKKEWKDVTNSAQKPTKKIGFR